jgi:hypothetical protein
VRPDSTIGLWGLCPWANRAIDADRNEDNQFAHGHAFGADDIDSRTHYVEHPAKTLFSVWVTLTEQKWVILRERRGDLIRKRSVSAGKVASGVAEFETYIRNNKEFIPNFGERHRQGERISTAFVESTINQVVNRRFVKKQQMHWTPRGAHLLLQTWTKVLNDDLEGVFRRWYPQFCAKLRDHRVAAALRKYGPPRVSFAASAIQ